MVISLIAAWAGLMQLFAYVAVRLQPDDSMLPEGLCPMWRSLLRVSFNLGLVKNLFEVLISCKADSKRIN